MAEADISAEIQNTSAALAGFQTSLNSLASSMSTQASVANNLAKAEQKRFKNISKGLGDAAKKMGEVGKKLGIVAGISFSMKGVLDILLKVERSATKFAKNLGTTRSQVERLFKVTTKVEKDFNKMGMSLDNAMEASGALAQEFGRSAKVTSSMVKTVGQLNKAFGISVGEAAAFTERMTEAGYNIENFTKVLAKDALKAGVNLGVVFRDVVKNVGMMEIYAGRSAEEMAKMVTSAAALGVSVGVFEKAAGAWKDFDQMSENIGQASRLFGAGFETALPSMIKMRELWATMQDDKLVEFTTNAYAKQMDIQNGILVMRKTGLKLTRDQLANMDAMYNGELEFGKRSIKQQIRFDKFYKVRNKFDKAHRDMNKAEFTAINDIVRASEKYGGKDLIELKQKERREALAHAEEIIAKRALEAKNTEALMKVIEDGMGFLEKIQNRLTAFIQPYLTTISSIFTDEFLNTHIMPWVTTIETKLKEVFATDGTGAFNFAKIWADLKAGNFMTVVKDVASSIGGLLKEGIIWAFSLDGDTTQGWDAVAEQLVTKLTDALNTAAPAMTKFVDEVINPLWQKALKFLTDKIFPEVDSFMLEAGDYIAGWMDTAHAYLVRETPKWGKTMGNIMAKGWEIAWPMIKASMEGIIRQIPGSSLFMDPETAGTMSDEEHYEYLRAKGQLHTMPAGQRQQIEAKMGIGNAGPYQSALGYSGWSRPSIVGEAGTEVGISRNALRELSSAGIPGYQYGRASRNRTGLAMDSASVMGRTYRHQSAQRAGESHRDPMRLFQQMNQNLQRIEEGSPWWMKALIRTGEFQGDILNTIADQQAKLLVEGEKATKVARAGHALLGGIGTSLSAAIATASAGGSKKQVREMAKRGLISGIVRDLSSQLGSADMDYLAKMQGYSALWGGGAAAGRVFTGPTLAMVGEGGANEVVIPTERIRKGLPINAGVARELGSIGVPGFANGADADLYAQAQRSTASNVAPGDASLYGGASGRKSQVGDMAGAYRDATGKPASWIGTTAGPAGPSRLSQSYEAMGGWQGGAATAGMQFADTYMRGGDMGAATGQALGAGIGFAATMALSAIPGIGPIVGPILGPMIGSFAGAKLAGALGYKPKYKRHRKRALKNLEEHVLTQGLFTHGQPGGVRGQLTKALLGGRKKHPSDKAKENLFTALTGSNVLRHGFAGGGSAPELVALLTGQVGNAAQENALYDKYNRAFYGVPMARGGIVTQPTRAVIGERGPEAVIPLGQHGGYQSREQQQDQRNIIGELKKQNQTMETFIKEIANRKIVMNVDGRNLAEAVGEGMQQIGNGG